MKSLLNRWLLLASIGAGMASSACAEADHPGASDGADAVAEAQEPLVFTSLLPSVPDVLAGDADLYTQNGRSTQYSIYVQKQRLEGGNVAVFWVDVHLIEQYYPDGSHLHYAGEQRVTLPWYVTDFNCDAVSLNGFIYDKSWNFKTVYSVNAATTQNCISFASIRVDGNGPDNTGNAQVQLSYDPEIVW
ncbi:MAG TPA: hypothetical protein VIV60_17970 [Polyangiaceae bacterium]